MDISEKSSEKEKTTIIEHHQKYAFKNTLLKGVVRYAS